MTINVLENSLKEKMDLANPNVISDGFRILEIGSVLRALPTFLRRKASAADAGVLATLLSLVLPDDAKGLNILRAYARAGTGTLGELAVQTYGTTPAAGQIAVAPNGDIVTLAADAYTDIDVVYQPDKYDIAEVTLPVATHVLTLPTQLTARGAILLLDATATVGTSTGRKIILVPGAGAPAAGQARLNLAKTTVTFAAADAVTQATVKVAIVARVDVDALLTAQSAIG